MTQTQFVESEVKNYIEFLFPELNKKDLNEKLNETQYFFSDDRKQILIDTKDFRGIMGWSDFSGMCSLQNDSIFEEIHQGGKND